MKVTPIFKIIIIFTLLLLPQISATAQEKLAFFARTIVEKSPLIKGDSALVSIVLYSDGDLQKVICRTKELRLKHAFSHRLKVDREETLGLRNYQGRTYQSLIWSQYVISAKDFTTIEIPAIRFEGVIRIYRQHLPGSLWKSEEYRDLHYKTSTEKLNIKVIDKPQKTTQELLQSGTGVL